MNTKSSHPESGGKYNESEDKKREDEKLMSSSEVTETDGTEYVERLKNMEERQKDLENQQTDLGRQIQQGAEEIKTQRRVGQFTFGIVVGIAIVFFITLTLIILDWWKFKSEKCESTTEYLYETDKRIDNIEKQLNEIDNPKERLDKLEENANAIHETLLKLSDKN